MGYLGTVVGAGPYFEAFRVGLHDLGYVEGRNVILEPRFSDPSAEQMPAFAAELVRLPVEVIVAVGNNAVDAARKEPSTIPIVASREARAFVTNLARPEGNVTGVSALAQGTAGKRLQLLQTAFPNMAKVAILGNPTSVYTVPPQFEELREAAPSLGLQLQIAEVPKPEAFDAALQAISTGRADGLVVIADTLTLSAIPAIIGFAAQRRLPAIYQTNEFTDAGGLMAYGVNLPDLSRRAASYADKILKGASVADLPVELPTKFDFIVNLKAAQAAGWTIPAILLTQATQVIQ